MASGSKIIDIADIHFYTAYKAAGEIAGYQAPPFFTWLKGVTRKPGPEIKPEKKQKHRLITS